MSTPSFELRGKRVWVAGHRGMVGGALCQHLAAEPCTVLTVDRDEVDLCRQAAVEAWLERTRPDAVLLAAAKAGGILANDRHPAAFPYDSLAIAANLVHAADAVGVETLVFLGSSCIYPKYAEQPIGEAAPLTGALAPTNEWYAIAKIAGLELCQACRREHGSDFVAAMPTNLYGPDGCYRADLLVAVGCEVDIVRHFVELAFAQVDRRITWEGEGVDEVGRDARSGTVLVRIDPGYFRPTDVDLLVSDATKARHVLGWAHEVGLEELVEEMVAADLAAMTANATTLPAVVHG